MYCHSGHNASPFYVGDLALESADGDTAQRHAHWDDGTVHLMGDIPLLSPVSPTLQGPGAEDILFSSGSSTSTSSPHMSELCVRDSQCATAEQGEAPDEGKQGPTRLKTRRTQNRQAQRRFRERREQQKTALLTRLEELQSKYDEITTLVATIKQENRGLETDKTRLSREVDVLRKWRRKLLSLMADLVRQDEMANDQLTTIAKSCSDTCWRRGIEYSRLLITMQTLLSVFEELQISPDGVSVGG
ncbi:hypothetical protein BJX63DRAFT_428514 [Aspergillus granulosus]|uniref:BZIP domain-containing protein n=1 Tax=Aspergillus granulosus TaxID=176169 RepID=A0ABR4HWF8_9EURO